MAIDGGGICIWSTGTGIKGEGDWGGGPKVGGVYIWGGGVAVTESERVQ